jgi:hypothetical protein
MHGIKVLVMVVRMGMIRMPKRVLEQLEHFSNYEKTLHLIIHYLRI